MSLATSVRTWELRSATAAPQDVHACSATSKVAFEPQCGHALGGMEVAADDQELVLERVERAGDEELVLERHFFPLKSFPMACLGNR
jgi:hypothetical protein